MRVSVGPIKQLLVHLGRKLSDEKYLKDYNIAD